MDNNLSNGKKKGGIIAVIILLITGIAGYFGIDLNNSNSDNSNSTTSVAVEQQVTDNNVSNNEDNATANSKDTQETALQLDKEDKKDKQTEDNKEENSQKDIGTSESEEVLTNYTFRTEQNLTQHFEKHGNEFDYKTKEEYVAGANRVISSKEALHKLEKEDGDDVYYLEATNEFVVVSKQGYIRTYFKPDKGIAYYNKQ